VQFDLEGAVHLVVDFLLDLGHPVFVAELEGSLHVEQAGLLELLLLVFYLDGLQFVDGFTRASALLQTECHPELRFVRFALFEFLF